MAVDRTVVDRYLDRIAYRGGRAPTYAHLAALQRAHLLAVPFENLDVFARTGVRVGLDWSVPKVVDRRRGGWCFELNGAFAALLDALGYPVTHHSAQVDDGAGALGPALDHLALLVHVEGRRLLVDVGFGDSALTPLDVDDAAPQDGAVRRSRLTPVDGGAALDLFDEGADGTWARQYRLDLTVRRLEEFEPRSTALQTLPGLPWTTRRFATRPTPDGGRVWLFGDRLKVRRPDGTVTETPVAPADWDAVLDARLGLRPAPLAP